MISCSGRLAVIFAGLAGDLYPKAEAQVFVVRWEKEVLLLCCGMSVLFSCGGYMYVDVVCAEGRCLMYKYGAWTIECGCWWMLT